MTPELASVIDWILTHVVTNLVGIAALAGFFALVVAFVRNTWAA